MYGMFSSWVDRTSHEATHLTETRTLSVRTCRGSRERVISAAPHSAHTGHAAAHTGALDSRLASSRSRLITPRAGRRGRGHTYLLLRVFRRTSYRAPPRRTRTEPLSRTGATHSAPRRRGAPHTALDTGLGTAGAGPCWRVAAAQTRRRAPEPSRESSPPAGRRGRGGFWVPPALPRTCKAVGTSARLPGPLRCSLYTVNSSDRTIARMHGHLAARPLRTPACKIRNVCVRAHPHRLTAPAYANMEPSRLVPLKFAMITARVNVFAIHTATAASSSWLGRQPRS